MKIIKTVFLVSLFNFFIVGAMVMAMQNKVVELPQMVETIPITTPETNTTTSPTTVPAQKKTPVVKTNTTDPFAIIFSQKETSQPTATAIPAQNTQQNSTPAPVQPVADNRCIIAIDGLKYDVGVFRNQHSGGNIFTCGSDMSAIFHGQHPNSFLQKMARYKI